MSAGSVRFRHFILGLLTQQPMSGYDIQRLLKSLGWLVGNPSSGSLYPALHALLEDGLVTVKVVPRQDKPPRKVYNITEAGTQLLQAWANQPVATSASLKAFVMRLILTGNFSQTALIAHLEQRRSQVAAHHTDLEQATGTQRERMEARRNLVLDYGLTLASAELAWLDETLNRLAQEPQP
jgi:DNA-binding PadR family transcriptional regulator